MESVILTNDNLIRNLMNTYAFKTIDPKLRKPLKKIIECTYKVYGKYIDWNKVVRLLDITKIEFKDNLKCPANFFIGYKYSYLEDKINYYINISINSKLTYMEVILALIHEFCHLVSLNMKKLFFSDNEKRVLTGLKEKYCINKNEINFGGCINEGLTEFITLNIAFEYFKNYKILFKNKLIKICKKIATTYSYNLLRKISNIMHDTEGEKLLESYFSGEVEIIKSEYDKVLGEDAWIKFVKMIDKEFESKYDRNKLIKDEPNKNKLKLLKYKSELLMLKFRLKKLGNIRYSRTKRIIIKSKKETLEAKIKIREFIIKRYKSDNSLVINKTIRKIEKRIIQKISYEFSNRTL